MAEIKRSSEWTIPWQWEKTVTFCDFILPVMNGGKVSSHSFIVL